MLMILGCASEATTRQPLKPKQIITMIKTMKFNDTYFPLDGMQPLIS